MRSVTKRISKSFLCVALLAPAFLASAQYRTRDLIARVAVAPYDGAVEGLRDDLKKETNDLEALYCLSIVHAQRGEIDRAMACVREAIDAGLPFGRFLAGPRELLRPLTESAEFRELSEKHRIEFLHGPLLGCVTDSSAQFWVRTVTEVPVQVFVSESEQMESPIKSTVASTSRDRDFTSVVAVRGLKPDTKYHYELSLAEKKQPKRWSFRTFPVVGAKAKFRIGFGGGAAHILEHERMWNTIVTHDLLGFLFLGDNVYIDHPDIPAAQQYCYYRRQCRPEFRRFTASTSIYAIWDDHDFATNDSWGGPEINKPEWKIPVWQLFRDNWNNPYYGGGESQPGCWFDFSIGDVDFFMLDGRYYRTDPKTSNPSMLGPAQKEWLFKKLKSSRATFKVLASPVPWAFGAKPGSLDKWNGFKEEREEVFSFLEENKIDGVILLSADRHRSEAWKIERDNGYTLYEFESSKLTNAHTHELMAGALFGYNAKCSFGLLSFDTTKPDPEVTYQIISIDDEVVYTLSLRKSQLTHKKGVSARSRRTPHTTQRPRGYWFALDTGEVSVQRAMCQTDENRRGNHGVR